MSNLETALRAKLKKMALHYVGGLSWEDAYREVAEDLIKWLDSHPDGWHDLRKYPNDLPFRNERQFATNGYYVIEARYNRADEWRGVPSDGILIGIIAWRPINWPEVPGYLQKKV